MSQKTEKQTRKEIRKIIAKNHDFVLAEVMGSLLKYTLPGRLLFAYTIVFKRVAKKRRK